MKQMIVRIRGKDHRVPVDDDGLVPIVYLEEIQSKRSSRSKTADGKKLANTTFPSKPEPKQAILWKLNPGKYDIMGIDTPIDIPVAIIPVKEVPTEPVPPRPRKKKSKGENGKEYSAGTWRKKVNFDDDPEKATHEAIRLLRGETEDATEEMRAYLEDSRYDEYGKTRYRYDDRDLVNDYYDKMWDEYKMYEMPYMYENKKGRKKR